MRSSSLIIIEDGSSTSMLPEAFPWDTAPRYLLRNRDTSYGIGFRDRVRAMNIEEVVTAPRLPWQIRTSSGSLAQFAVSAWTM
jgi:hypothetical protein